MNVLPPQIHTTICRKRLQHHCWLACLAPIEQQHMVSTLTSDLEVPKFPIGGRLDIIPWIEAGVRYVAAKEEACFIEPVAVGRTRGTGDFAIFRKIACRITSVVVSEVFRDGILGGLRGRGWGRGRVEVLQ